MRQAERQEVTIKIAVDNTVSELPIYNFKDIAACARKWADQLEAGEQGADAGLGGL